MRKYINRIGMKQEGPDKISSNSRLAKAGKTEFTSVIEYFSDEPNEEVELFLQIPNKKGYQSLNCILRMISRWAKNTLKTVLNSTDINKTANALHYHRYVNQPSNSSLNPMFSNVRCLEEKCK